ncbi:unnamed protein product [Brassica oleracea var. botrytis]
MTDIETARTVVGAIGNVIAFGLYSAPIPTMVKICKMKSVAEFMPDPYIATVINCMMWAFYGLPFVTPDNILVITNNGVGLVMELVYVIIFFIFATSPVRKKITIAIVIEVIFMAVVVFCTLYFLHTPKQRSMLVGILCIIFNVIMYAAPLTAMAQVIKTKSVKYMPFSLSLANFMNGAIWIVYSYTDSLFVLRGYLDKEITEDSSARQSKMTSRRGVTKDQVMIELVIRDDHCLDTQWNLTSDFTGSLERKAKRGVVSSIKPNLSHIRNKNDKTLKKYIYIKKKEKSNK